MKNKSLKSLSYPAGIYGNISGYQPTSLEEKDLANYRTGLSAANPAGALLMVKEIDRLRALLESPNHNKRSTDRWYQFVITVRFQKDLPCEEFKGIKSKIDAYFKYTELLLKYNPKTYRIEIAKHDMAGQRSVCNTILECNRDKEYMESIVTFWERELPRLEEFFSPWVSSKHLNRLDSLKENIRVCKLFIKGKNTNKK